MLEISGWFNGTVPYQYPRLFSRKVRANNTDRGGFELSLHLGGTACDIRGGEQPVSAAYTIPDISQSWVQLSVLFEGATASLFTNGVLCAVSTGAINLPSDNGNPLGIGNKPTCAANPSFLGQYDEIRLRGGALSADRIKADYDMIANRKFCTYGAVKKGAK